MFVREWTTATAIDDLHLYAQSYHARSRIMRSSSHITPANYRNISAQFALFKRGADKKENSEHSWMIPIIYYCHDDLSISLFELTMMC